MLHHLKLLWIVTGLALWSISGQTLLAQQARTRLELTSLTEVQNELKLTDEQKKLVGELLAKFREGAPANGQVDKEARAARVKQVAKLNTELVEKLTDAQKTRLNGLLIQVNGAVAAIDPVIAKALQLSPDELAKLRSANQANQTARRQSADGQKDLKPKERQEAMKKLLAKEGEALMALLTEDQKKKLEELKGMPLTIDQAPLRARRK
jgi:hypothetical protein